MTREVHDLLPKAELLEDGPHCCLLRINVFHGFWVILVEVGNKDQELSEAPLLKQSHEAFNGQNQNQLDYNILKSLLLLLDLMFSWIAGVVL